MVGSANDRPAGCSSFSSGLIPNFVFLTVKKNEWLEESATCSPRPALILQNGQDPVLKPWYR